MCIGERSRLVARAVLLLPLFLGSRAFQLVPSPNPKPLPLCRARHRGCTAASAGRRTIGSSGASVGMSAGSSSGGVPQMLQKARVALAKNTRWLVAGSAALVLVYRRDAVTISLVGGAIANAIVSKILKRVLDQDRPEGAGVSDPGMPSSHAMSLFFFASYLSCALLYWSPWPLLPRTAAIVSLAAFAVNSASWRVAAKLHTSDQVVVGSVVGGMDGALWFLATSYRWDLVEKLDLFLATSSLAAPTICGALVFGAVVVGSVERKLGKWAGSGGK